jgi:hypothetical protein
MKKRMLLFNFFALLMIQFAVAIPSIAGDYSISDIALSPGADATQLNLNWHTNSAILDDSGVVTDVNACAVEIAKKHDVKKFLDFFRQPEKPEIFYGTKASSGTDENGAADYYCEVEVSGLHNKTEYEYRLGDGAGAWTDTYGYATKNKNKYGFFFIADSQIGASANYSSTNAKTDIATWYINNTSPYSAYDDTLKATLVTQYVAGTLGSYENGAYKILNTEIKKRYDSYKGQPGQPPTFPADYPELAAYINAIKLTVQNAAADSDTVGWDETVGAMTEKFPDGAFLLSNGDQVENAREYEWTGYFSAEALTSLPVAPAVGSHDRAANFGYHFNLPNESATYGVNDAGGDYYFRYGNALVIVLNMDTTTSLYPMDPPPPPGDPNACRGIDSEATFEAAYQTNLEAGTLASYLASIDQHEAFMDAAIAANPNVKWKIVMWHYSIYSAGNHASDSPIRALRRDFVPVLEDYDVDLVLLAHDHVYTRTYQMLGDDPQLQQKIGANGEIVNPTGILYITGATSSGSKYYSLNCALDNSTYDTEDYFEYVDKGYNFGVPSFSYIDIDNDSLTISTYSSEDTDTLLDSYTMVKDDEKPMLRWGWPKPRIGWNNTSVSIPYEAFDRISGVKSATPGSPLIFSSEGAAQTRDVTVTDYADLTAVFTSPRVNIDLTAPFIEIKGITDGASYKVNSKVKAGWIASDNLSGIFFANGTVPNGGCIDTKKPGIKSFTVKAIDRAGNVTTKTVSYTVVK